MTEEEIEEFGERCPKCKTEWSFVPRIVCAGNWVHCDKCAKKAEKIMKEHEADAASDWDSLSKAWGAVDWGHRK